MLALAGWGRCPCGGGAGEARGAGPGVATCLPHQCGVQDPNSTVMQQAVCYTANNSRREWPNAAPAAQGGGKGKARFVWRVGQQDMCKGSRHAWTQRTSAHCKHAGEIAAPPPHTPAHAQAVGPLAHVPWPPAGPGRGLNQPPRQRQLAGKRLVVGRVWRPASQRCAAGKTLVVQQNRSLLFTQ